MNLSSVILVNVAAGRPAAGVAGRLFFASDAHTVSRDTGEGWDDVTPAPPPSSLILAGTLEARPVAARAGRLYFSTDAPAKVFRDDGEAWIDVTPGSSGGGMRLYSAALVSQTDITVTHALDTLNVIVQVFDGDGIMTSPESCAIVDANNVRLTFGVTFSGKVVIAG